MRTTSPPSVVIGLDCSTQSAKAVAWTQQGDMIAEGTAPIDTQNRNKGWFEQQVEDWWHASCDALKNCVDTLEGYDIVGMAIANQRETIGFIDAQGTAVYPAISWMDNRCRHEVKQLCKNPGDTRLHEITGVYPDVTPAIFSCEWLRKNAPDIYKNIAHFVDVNAFLTKRLCNTPTYTTSFASADPMGFFAVQQKQWSAELLQRVAIDKKQLATPVPSGTKVGEISEHSANRTGLPQGMPVFAAGGDGQCAAIGANCIRSDRAYMNLGSAAVSGIWCPDFNISKSWRIKVPVNNDGYLYESVMRSGTVLLDWFVKQFIANTDTKSNIFSHLFTEIEKISIGSDGVMVLPYWLGVMDPHWDLDARGAIVGLSASRSKYHIFRAIIEAITISQVSAIKAFESQTGHCIETIFAVGGGSKSPLWTQMIADAAAKTVVVSDATELSSLGAGMVAAYGVGWYPSIAAASNAMSPVVSPTGVKTYTPNPDNTVQYQELINIYSELYGATASVHKKLLRFAEKWRHQ